MFSILLYNEKEIATICIYIKKKITIPMSGRVALLVQRRATKKQNHTLRGVTNNSNKAMQLTSKPVALGSTPESKIAIVTSRPS